MKDKIFGVLQRVGRSFMLPIALLPVAGLLLGVGSSFTNATMLETYGLTGIIYPGSLIYTILDIMNQCGNTVFANLPLLFAMGVAIGMAIAAGAAGKYRQLRHRRVSDRHRQPYQSSGHPLQCCHPYFLL